MTKISSWTKGLFTLWFLVTVAPHNGSTAKILSISFISTRSHKITYEPLLEALAARGHDLTVVSPVPAKRIIPNITEIQTFDVDDFTDQMPDMFDKKKENKQINPFELVPQMVAQCEDSLNLPQVKNLKKQKFDLIFVSSVINECALAFASTFDTPIVLISPLSVPGSISSYFGNPSPPSFVPNLLSGYTDSMTFYERTMNFLMEAGWRSIYTYYLLPIMEAAYRRQLGDHLPSAGELFGRSSLILSNSHFSITSIRPFLPDIVEVGGMHCRNAGALPKDLEDFVASSGTDGFILFSMGSLLKGSNMPEETRLALVSVFKRLKQKVIWKWETEEMKDIPKNVKLSKWVPQQDVLGHPKIKAFITHGGFGSTTEAVYHGVPVIGLPIFADQTMNMQNAKTTGYGIVLDFNTFTEDELFKAITAVVTDPTYKQRAKEISAIFRDQPMRPLDRAVFWSEYIIRHNGALHLRSAGRDLNFLQYHCLDVIGLIIATIIACCWVLLKICKFCAKIVRGVFGCDKPKASVVQNKKKKKN